jgi:hypothetical protein
MLTGIPPNTPLGLCPSCSAVVPDWPYETGNHVQFHVSAGATRCGDPCPVDPWAPPSTYPGAPGTAPPSGSVLAWACGHTAVAP